MDGREYGKHANALPLPQPSGIAHLNIRMVEYSRQYKDREVMIKGTKLITILEAKDCKAPHGPELEGGESHGSTCVVPVGETFAFLVLRSMSI